jgi:beta-xylosidase
MMKNFCFFAIVFLCTLTLSAQGVKPLPSLHVEGKWLVDTHGNHVVLHGVMDTPSMWFNSNRWSGGYNNTGATNCKNYFEKIYAGMEKANCTVFRLHLDPAWTNDPSNSYKYAGSEGQSSDATGEADISKFNPTRLTSFMKTLYYPLMEKAIKHGMYVVVRPPGVCPHNLKVGDYYQKYLLTVWDLVTQNDSIRRHAGQISIELANEPVNLKDANGNDSETALHDYFQPIVDQIRANGFTGIIWVPGTGYQSNYRSYKTHPIEGYNIGYAVHDYPGWYNCSDDNPDPATKRRSFLDAVPVVNTNPVIITEVDWSPLREPKEVDHVNEMGQTVYKNLGTWATATTSKWGKAYKALLDYCGNISMTLTSTDDYMDVTKLLKDGTVTPSFNGNPEACGKACFDWYAEYYQVDRPKPDFESVPVSDRGKNYENPIVRADVPDPDVIRVGDTYYMVSTTMHHFPGATIMKSQDMVNWEYCAQPLLQLASTDRYNLKNDQNAYAAGMWACSMKYHNGKFYILINGNDAGGWILSTSTPEGTWEKKKLSRIYYDPGMLFDNGKVYVACGNGRISVCELDEDFNFKQEKTVITKDGTGLEGCHFYKIGDYYYIYATYGGWPSGQVVFRSKNVFGPYEEKMLLEKYIDGKVNTIHQGSLIQDVGNNWWTIMQEDLGALGRMPNLQPVTWENDWPIVGNNGKPYASHTKPKATGDIGVKRLPTTDNFRTYPLGMQWQWNHNPDDKAWSLFERPGWLRLKTSNVTNRLTQARNMLTQRIFAYNGKPSIGTVRLDMSRMLEGDRAGICILQDPQAMIGVEKKDNKYQVYWRQDTLRIDNNFTPKEVVASGVEVDSIVYLRATIDYGTSKTKFYYSLDNKTWKSLGGETTMSFNLNVFVGARFGLYCYATKAEGGVADFDWFTTEEEFDEDEIYPAFVATIDEKMFTVSKLTASAQTMEAMIGGWSSPGIKATFLDKHTENVTTQTSYTTDRPRIVEFHNGQMTGVGEGTTNVTATYSDTFGNLVNTTFTVNATFFPYDVQFVNTTIAGEGLYRNNPSSKVFKPSENGLVGWVYPDGVDMSAYKYLVVNLYQKQKADARLNLYPTTNLKGACYTTQPFGDDTQIVVNLKEAKYTSNTTKGRPLATDHIHIVAFSGNGKYTISIKDIYLTNNEDFTRMDPAGIEAISETTDQPVSVYSLSGQLVRHKVSRSQATEGLPAGLYVVGGKKVIVRQ